MFPKTVSSQDTVKNTLLVFEPDVIILDVVLKGDDGRELCKEIKKKHHKNIPIILISWNPLLLKDYKECEADAVIEKPFDIKTVIEQINKVLNVCQPA